MEAVYRAACGGLALAVALVLTAPLGAARVLRLMQHTRAISARLLVRLGSSVLGRLVVSSRRMRALASIWGRAASSCLGSAVGREGGAGLIVCTVTLGGLAGFVVAESPLGLVAGSLVSVVVVILKAESTLRLHDREVANEMPVAFRSLASSLAAGRTLSQAMANLGEKGQGAVSEAFSKAALRLSCGFSAQEALDKLSEELDAPGTELLTCALSVSHRTGSPLMRLFQRSASLLERQRELERVLSVKTAQVRLSVRVVCLLPAIMLALLTLISTDYRAGLATTAGMGSVTIAIMLDVVAVLVIRHLMRGVL